ncbi:MAG TPA: hypothetical protein VJ926_03085 [Patescibacteria group bacterium]|nr:hypothetical protein [Patescibacteria group bacterium]
MNNLFQEKLKKIDDIIKVLAQTNNFKDAYVLYKKIKTFLDDNKVLKEKDYINYRRFERNLFKAQFLCLNYFDDWQEISSLIKNHLDLAFEMPGYDFWSKLKVNLQYIFDWSERDEIKEMLVKNIRDCNRKIINEDDYNVQVITKVSNWIKDFISNIDFEGNMNPVKKAEYINNNKNIKFLKTEDKQKVTALLNLYEALNLSSQAKNGFEETVFMVVDGKKIILNRNGIDDVDINLKKIKNVKAYQNEQEDEQFKDEDRSIEESNNEEGSNESIKDVSEGEDSDNNYSSDVQEKILVLKGMLSEYDQDSLEAKALQEEIDRLDKINVKQG